MKSEERILKIVLIVLQEGKPIYFKDIQERLDVSKSTLDNDMKKFRVLLKEYDLLLVSKPKVGLEFIGSEMSLRIVLNSLIHQCCNIDTCIKRHNENGIFSPLEQDVFGYIDFDVVSDVYRTFLKNQSQSMLVNENYYIHVAIMFAISFKRMRDENFIKHFSEAYTHFMKSHIYKMIDELRPMMMDVPFVEKCFLCFIIDSYNIHKRILLKEDWVQIQLMTLQLIHNMQQITDVEFEKDSPLFERLFYHLEALIQRAKQGLFLFNPMTALIKEQYGYTFYAVRKALKDLEAYCQVEFDDAEVAYMTVHFCASEEKLEKERFVQYRVVILCGHGIATGELLAQKLNKIEYLDVIGVINSKDLNILKRLDAHLVIKTVDVDIPCLPSIKINPLFTDQDLELLKQELTNYVPIKKVVKEKNDFKELYADIMNVIKNEDKALFLKLQPKIEDIFFRKKFMKKEGIQPMLEEVLELHHVLLQKNAENWQEAIKLAASPLVSDGYIQQRYVDAMIENVEKFGPYIVIVKGFALAHARPEDGVNKLGVSVLTLEKPVAFHSTQNDPVQTIICLAAIDNNSHLKIMGTIASLLNNQQKLEKY